MQPGIFAGWHTVIFYLFTETFSGYFYVEYGLKAKAVSLDC